MDDKRLRDLLAGGPLASLLPFTEESFLGSLRHGDFPRWRKLARELPAINPSVTELGDVISIGRTEDTDSSTRNVLEGRLRELMPWRKGPYSLFGLAIDTEWQSQIKWARLRHHIKPLTGKTVLDVGAGNGYYSWRMCGSGAALTLGMDPHLPYVGQFQALARYLPELPVHLFPLGLDEWPHTPEAFDTAFSMGVLYHRRSPVDHLLQLFDCLQPGGELVLESIVVDGPEGYSLIPQQRYARMNNVWFLPSNLTIERWLARCGFINIRLIDESVTSVEEQRRTDWMPFDSFIDSLDENDGTRTIEGYPAPKRSIFLADKPA